MRILKLLFCQDFLYLIIFILYEQLPYMKAAITETHFWYNIQDEEWKLNKPWVNLFIIASVFLSFCRSCFTSFCLHVCPFFRPFVWLVFCLFFCLLALFTSFCLYVLLFVYPFPSFCLANFVCLFFCLLALFTPFCLYVLLSVCPFVCMSFWLYVL